MSDKFASGGLVRGPSESGDSGEYHIPERALRHYGRGLLERLLGSPVEAVEERLPAPVQWTDRDKLLCVANNIQQFWGPLASQAVNGDANTTRIAGEDAAVLREIAERLR